MLDFVRSSIDQDYDSIQGIVSPSHDEYVSTKPGALPHTIRCVMASLRLSGRPYDRVDKWESLQPHFIDYPDVIAHVAQEYPGTDVYYVVGQDHYYQQNVADNHYMRWRDTSVQSNYMHLICLSPSLHTTS